MLSIVISDGRSRRYRVSIDPAACSTSARSLTLLFNALRLGFLVLPEPLVGAFEAARSFVDRHPPTLGQAVLAEFMLDGHFGHHVRRMRQIYAERLFVLREAARKHLRGMVDVAEAVAGMRTIAWIKAHTPGIAIARRGRSLGLELTALSEFTIRHSHPAALILGFAGCNTRELERGVGVLAAAFESGPLPAGNPETGPEFRPTK